MTYQTNELGERIVPIGAQNSYIRTKERFPQTFPLCLDAVKNGEDAAAICAQKNLSAEDTRDIIDACNFYATQP